MKYSLLLAFLPFSLVTFFLLAKNRKVNTPREQLIYTWQSKTVGYNDLQHLYQADSNASKVSFFNRRSLQQLQVSINCRIKKTIMSRNVRGELASFQITDPIIGVEQGGQAINTDLLKNELMHPVLADISRQGLITMVRVDTAIADFSANMIKAILSRLQFVKPMADSNEWQAGEENTCGVFLAKYRRIKSHKDGFEFEKQNGGYTKLKSPAPNQQVIDGGKSNISTDTAGTVVEINAVEEQAVLFSIDTVAISASVIAVKLASTIKIAGEEVASLTDLLHSPNYNSWSTLGEALSEDKINRLVYTKTLGNDNLSSLMEALSRQDEKEKENLIRKFRALAYLFPRNCEDLGRAIKNQPLESYTFSVLSSALARAETETALNALVSVIDTRREEEETVIHLLPILTTCKTPTEQAILVAKQLAFSPASTPDVAATAQLALGGLANSFSKTDHKKSEQLTGFLLDKMKTEKDTLQKIMVLANTGSATVLPVFKSYLEHPGTSKEVRVAAVSGLRLMKDSSSVSYLLKMVNNRDTVIVKEAKEVIAFQKEQF